MFFKYSARPYNQFSRCITFVLNVLIVLCSTERCYWYLRETANLLNDRPLFSLLILYHQLKPELKAVISPLLLQQKKAPISTLVVCKNINKVSIIFHLMTICTSVTFRFLKFKQQHKYTDQDLYPFPYSDIYSRRLFENIVAKREITQIEPFILLLQCLGPYLSRLFRSLQQLLYEIINAFQYQMTYFLLNKMINV